VHSKRGGGGKCPRHHWKTCFHADFGGRRALHIQIQFQRYFPFSFSLMHHFHQSADKGVGNTFTAKWLKWLIFCSGKVQIAEDVFQPPF
jgi:hypothetical protein